MGSTLRVRRYRDSNRPSLRYVVNFGSRDKRFRRFFTDRKSADTFAQLKEIELTNQGQEGATFPTQLRVSAQQADELLEPFEATLLDAARFYAEHLRRVRGSKPVAEVAQELLAARKADGASSDYLADLRSKFVCFAREFGDRMIADLTAREITTWLRSLGVGTVSRNTTRSRLSTLFEFARRQGYTTANPIRDVERAKERGGEIGILSVDQIARLLESASPELLPYFAIGAFAGLRSAELERLSWSEVDFESAVIEVKASKSKTASRRLVDIQANLADWLAPYRSARGQVCPANLRRKQVLDRQRAGLLGDWPQNALRHSFGSYQLARFRDASALALQMGNSPTIIFRHYRELVKPADAARYWSLAPSHPGKVVSLRA